VKALLVGCAYFAPRRPEMTRLRGALNDVAAIREALASGYGLDADDPEKTRVLIDRPAKEKKTSFAEPSKPATMTSSFFGAFSGRKTSALRNDDESDDWKTGLAVPPQLRNTNRFVDDDDDDDQINSGNADRSAPTAANVRAGLRWLTRDAKPGDVLFFHFSGHATQVPSLVSETGELDGADEALCCVDTDWETPSTCITERDLLESFFADKRRAARRASRASTPSFAARFAARRRTPRMTRSSRRAVVDWNRTLCFPKNERGRTMSSSGGSCPRRRRSPRRLRAARLRRARRRSRRRERRRRRRRRAEKRFV
jgi:hypothetical protein